MTAECSFIVVLIISYTLGCFSAAYYITRLFRGGEDIRNINSGNAGATNAGRVLGKWGFAVVFLLDFLKGLVAVFVARYLCASAWAEVLAVFCAVAGHIWPLQLGFRGGRGISTAFGGFMAISPALAGIVFVIAAILFLSTRRYHLSGLIVIILFPALSAILEKPLYITAGSIATGLLLLVAQRQNIVKLLAVKNKPCESGESKEDCLGQTDEES